MTNPAPHTVTVNADRLWQSLMDLAEIGAYDDERTGLRGVNRLALTDADAAGRRQVIGWMEQAGLAVCVDRMGNIYGRPPGTDPTAAPFLTGWHIDSVATAGAFDGCLGGLGGIEVVRTLNERGIATRRPIEVGVFTEEEGVRFGTDMLGSAVAAGRLTLEYAHALTDRDGRTLGAARAAAPESVRGIAFNQNATPPTDLVAFANTRAVRALAPTSSGGVGTARGVAGMYAAAITEVDGRAPLLKPETITEFARVHYRGTDLVTGNEDVFGLGFEELSGRYRVLGADAFGHSGATGSLALALADPDSGVAYAYTRRRFGMPSGFGVY
ncbi:hypothetical protein [Streptomyces sp. NPDC001816]|uniref:hypothetical protein n=1 Tax=Streptomyces sp. NPDC001816 TaxID=3364612 RepID=UPI00367ECD03